MVLIDNAEHFTEEEKRLKEDRERTKYWKKWGPYVSERQWGTGEPPKLNEISSWNLPGLQCARTTRKSTLAIANVQLRVLILCGVMMVMHGIVGLCWLDS